MADSISSSASLGLQYHFRSISLPSRLHPHNIKIEAELNKLKTWAISSNPTTVPLSADTIQTALAGLVELYSCVEELLHSPLTQQALLQHQHEMLVEEALEGSVGLLDSCGVARDLFLAMKEHGQALQSVLRRKGGDLSIENNISAYMCLRKKVQKEIVKSLRTLKQIENKIGSSILLDVNHHLSMVIGVLREVTVITISVFRSFFLFLSIPSSMTKPGGWSLISKLMFTRSAASERDQKIFNEVGGVDFALHSLHGCIRRNDAKDDVQMARRRLQALDASIDSLEARLDCLFRSISLPSRLHPHNIKIEAESNKLKIWAISANPTTVLLSAYTIQTALVGLVELYNCVEELLHSPLTQQPLLQHQHGMLVEEALKRSVGLLDSCGVARDLFLATKEHGQALQSALRRKGGDLSIENNISAYMGFRKKLQKEMVKSLRTLKQMENKIGSSTLFDVNHYLSMVIVVLGEVTTITISVFRSFFLFLSVPSSMTKPGGWSLISRLIFTRSAASERGHKIFNEVGELILLCTPSMDAFGEMMPRMMYKWRGGDYWHLMLALTVLRLD
ncbi:hypothetical protein F0562_003997 [Nyssa sinensis]|uniref:DUF241 domain-containing protein n=1 Tax=Nyssa sinensis TaxID=561372 RepID=A0A5J5BXD9_9ASTE|nr:hypothetical protein F0562_003997 [Nyssa sinensis]